MSNRITQGSTSKYHWVDTFHIYTLVHLAPHFRCRNWHMAN